MIDDRQQRGGIADAYYYRLLRSFLIIFLIVALGIFIVKNFMDYRYKVIFIKSPCQLCQELNPEVSSCFLRKENLFPDGNGGWKYENGTPVDKKKANQIIDASINFSQFK